MMTWRKIIAVSCILFFGLIILCLNMPALSQYLPWSWPPAGPFPGTGQIPLYNYPPTNYFPTTGFPITGQFPSSGWPIYSPPPTYSRPPSQPASTTGRCPVGLLTGLTIEEEFGPGASDITRCLIFTYDSKTVVHINQFESRPGRPYGLNNIMAMVDDYEITHGTKDYKIVAVNHSGGATQLLNQNAATPHPDAINNIYQLDVEALIVKGVKFYM